MDIEVGKNNKCKHTCILVYRLVLVVLTKFEAFFMDKHFNLRQWKTSTFLPTLGISLILTLSLLIILSSTFNRIYLEKKAYKKDKTKFTITVSFKTLYTIFGVVFLLCGIIQSLIFLKGERGGISK